MEGRQLLEKNFGPAERIHIQEAIATLRSYGFLDVISAEVITESIRACMAKPIPSTDSLFQIITETGVKLAFIMSLNDVFQDINRRTEANE